MEKITLGQHSAAINQPRNYWADREVLYYFRLVSSLPCLSMGCFCSKQEELVETKNVYILRSEIISVMIVTSHLSSIYFSKTYSMKLRRSVRAKLRPSVFAVGVSRIITIELLDHINLTPRYEMRDDVCQVIFSIEIFLKTLLASFEVVNFVICR